MACNDKVSGQGIGNDSNLEWKRKVSSYKECLEEAREGPERRREEVGFVENDNVLAESIQEPRHKK